MTEVFGDEKEREREKIKIKMKMQMNQLKKDEVRYFTSRIIWIEFPTNEMQQVMRFSKTEYGLV